MKMAIEIPMKLYLFLSIEVSLYLFLFLYPRFFLSFFHLFYDSLILLSSVPGLQKGFNNYAPLISLIKEQSMKQWLEMTVYFFGRRFMEMDIRD